MLLTNIINNTIPTAANMKMPPLPESFLSPVPVSHVLVPVDCLVVPQFDVCVKLSPEQYVERDGVHVDGEHGSGDVSCAAIATVFVGKFTRAFAPEASANW